MPWPVQEVHGTVRDGHAVIAGGMVRDAGGKPVVSARVGIFDPAADRWTEGPPLPETRHHAALATIDGVIYAIGGATHVPGREGRWHQRSDVFALQDGLWSRSTPLPLPQSEAVVLVHDGQVHLIGGRTANDEAACEWADQHDVATHRMFDPRTATWSEARPLPSPRNSAAAGVIDGMFYVVGGRTMEDGNIDHLDRYDPATDRWDMLRPLPHPAGGLAAVALGGALYAFGGEELGVAGPGGVIGKTWRYEPATDRWEALPDMLTPRHGLAAVVLRGQIFAIGGAKLSALGGTTDLVEAFTSP